VLCEIMSIGSSESSGGGIARAAHDRTEGGRRTPRQIGNTSPKRDNRGLINHLALYYSSVIRDPGGPRLSEYGGGLATG